MNKRTYRFPPVDRKSVAASLSWGTSNSSGITPPGDPLPLNLYTYRERQREGERERERERERAVYLHA